MTLLSSAANAAGFMAEVGKNGNKHARWDKICDRFATYCDHGAGALIAAFAGVVLMLIISAVSISRLVQPNKCSISTTAWASPSVVPWKHRLFKITHTHTCVFPLFLTCLLSWVICVSIYAFALSITLLVNFLFLVVKCDGPDYILIWFIHCIHHHPYTTWFFTCLYHLIVLYYTTYK